MEMIKQYEYNAYSCGLTFGEKLPSDYDKEQGWELVSVTPYEIIENFASENKPLRKDIIYKILLRREVK